MATRVRFINSAKGTARAMRAELHDIGGLDRP